MTKHGDHLLDDDTKPPPPRKNAMHLLFDDLFFDDALLLLFTIKNLCHIHHYTLLMCDFAVDQSKANPMVKQFSFLPLDASCG